MHILLPEGEGETMTASSGSWKGSEGIIVGALQGNGETQHPNERGRNDESRGDDDGGSY